MTASSGSRPVVAASAPTHTGAHIVWIRVGDLRVHDHPGLHAALLPPSVPIVPLFVFDPEEAANTTPAFQRLVHEAVRELRVALRDRGADLVVRSDHPRRTSSASRKRPGRPRVVQARARVVQAVDASSGAAAARAAGVESIHEWSAPLRECADAVRATEEAYLTTEARNERGARVAPWATEE